MALKKIDLILAMQQAALAGAATADEVLRAVRDGANGSALLNTFPERKQREDQAGAMAAMVQSAGKIERAGLQLQLDESRLRAGLVGLIDELAPAGPDDVRFLNGLLERVASQRGRTGLDEAVAELAKRGTDVGLLGTAVALIYPVAE